MTLNGRLSCISLMPYDVGGSGECFFRSVSHQPYGTPEFRMAGINHINSQPEICIGFSLTIVGKITFNKCQHQGYGVII